MHSLQSTNESNIQINDSKWFKYLLLIFIFFKVLAILLYLFRPIISAILYDSGTTFLLIGIFLLSKKYQYLKSGFKVLVLFILTMISYLIVAILNNKYPHSSHVSVAVETVLEQITKLENGFGKHVFIIIVFNILTGVLMISTAFIFTNWINNALNLQIRTKIYFNFGRIFIGGVLIQVLGFIIFSRALHAVVYNGSKTSTVAIPGLIIFLGSIILLISFAIEIIAGIQFYNKFNALGNRIPPPVRLAEGRIFCSNCGSKLEENTKICHNCGMPVEINEQL